VDRPAQTAHGDVRRRAAALVLAVAAVLTAFIAGRATRSTTPQHTARPADVTTTTTTPLEAAGAAALLHGLKPFVDDWGAHGSAVNIDENGVGKATWRAYKACQEDPAPPCDRNVGNVIVNGGAALFVITATDGSSADGYVLTSNDPSKVPVGPLHLELRPNDHLAFPGLGVEGGPLCGHRATWDCGA